MSDRPAGLPLPVAAMTEIDGVMAVYSARLGQVLVLSESASEIWRLLDGVRSERQVVAALVELYAVTPDQIARDVSAMLASFHESGLIEGWDAGAAAAR